MQQKPSKRLVKETVRERYHQIGSFYQDLILNSDMPKSVWNAMEETGTLPDESHRREVCYMFGWNVTAFDDLANGASPEDLIDPDAWIDVHVPSADVQVHGMFRELEPDSKARISALIAEAFESEQAD